ncbi:hypothetical protein PF008_g15519 [Phytophthora fragariae]|uniref:Zn(2)-C6 fungal-type domain-containing protein n=1 Tax=Phytophthora fragariae TaxID=53985 RepID=A0A6G0REB8_9STRA|nr:hypothetical protein PF008_g15519 [Phytophthora fragariae]
MRLRERRTGQAARRAPSSPPASAVLPPLQQHSAPLVLAAPDTGKRSPPACASCRQSKRRCGPSSDNQH